MLLKKNEKKNLVIAIVLAVLGIVLFSILYFKPPKERRALPAEKKTGIAQPAETDKTKTPDAQKEDGVARGDIIVLPTIDYKDLARDEKLKELMETRKKNMGLDKSLDMIVQSDESFTIGDVRISMSDILKQAFLKQGEVFEEKIGHSGEIRPGKIKEYGIYVVQPGDNIWNIHFNILKEYYGQQGIKVAPKADEPINQGLSSGVGKILKFSEAMVIIYNMLEKKVDTDINLLEPLSKIVVYNMDEVFSLLKEINYENIDRIQFDGKTIWIPAEK